ncbi:MAG: DNA-3-methyladenine glycosylase I [Planctomycetota bacterium]|jgi:DNA-3-methyladenine glycosylase I
MTPPRRPALVTDEHGVSRCWWCDGDDLYRAYHDTEWGLARTDDRRLLEKICLEGFQCGLAWITVLRKRPRFREVFAGFDPERVARMTKRQVDRLVLDAGIIRHRGKIESTINNARRALEMIDEHGSLAAFLAEYRVDRRAPRRRADLPARTPESTALSRALKQRGWRFVGPTTAYAFMQSVGLVNDHLAGCHVRDEAERRRTRWSRLTG